MSIKQLKDGRYQVDVRPQGAEGKRIRKIFALKSKAQVKWFTEFGHLNRGDMLTSEQHRCHN
ncbi:hypothetical protein NQ237_24205, partial [Escherichia coli]|nr:hypothetical protein [Escherichia coli]